MHIQTDDQAVSWENVAKLFHDVGWGERNPDEIRAAFGRSTFKAFAFEGSELVGVGRTIDDGRFYATVVDVVVRPPYQHRGIGRAIVEDLQSRMKGFLVVTLTAAPDVQPFYHRLGWRTQSTA